MQVSESIRTNNYRYVWGIAVFITISVVGLYYVKWDPYYHKAIIAAAKHSIGDSIVGANSAMPPPLSLKAAAITLGPTFWQSGKQ